MIVKKPTNTNVQTPMNIYIPQQEENDREILPTEVNVPEPPTPLNKKPDISCEIESTVYENEILKIKQSKERLEAEIKVKMEKFHSSYAFTRYNQDMDILHNQKLILEQQELKTKQLLLLTSGSYAKRALEVVKRIKNYLGVQEEIIKRYTTFDNEIRIMCHIYQGSALDFFSTDNTGIEWQICESIEKEYYWPNRVDFNFTVQASEMIPVLEAAIKSELGDYIIIKK